MARKGDLAVVELRHSSFTLGSAPSADSVTFEVGTVESVTRTFDLSRFGSISDYMTDELYSSDLDGDA